MKLSYKEMPIKKVVEMAQSVNRRLDWPENKHLYWPGVSALDAG
jgi:hypothetical protein